MLSLNDNGSSDFCANKWFAAINVLPLPWKVLPNSCSNCNSDVLDTVSFFHFSSLPGTSHQSTLNGLNSLVPVVAPSHSLWYTFPTPFAVEQIIIWVSLPADTTG